MKNITLILIAILLLAGMSSGSELEQILSPLATLSTQVGIIDDTLDSRADFNWQTVRLEIDFSVAGWNEEVPHEFAAVTGSIDYEITAHCSTDVTTNAVNDSLHFLFSQADIALSLDGDQIDAGESIFPPTGWFPDLVTQDPAVPQVSILNNMGVWRGSFTDITGDTSWDYDLTNGAFTGGIIVMVMRWRARTIGSQLVAGDGS